jgi:hypothetical protein
MVLFWLCYRWSDRLAAVAMIEAPSLIHARMHVAVDGLDREMVYAEGHQLDAKLSAALKPSEIDRMLSPAEARSLVDRFDQM